MSTTRGPEYGRIQVTEDGRLCDEYGDPYPDAVQRLRANLLPSPDKSADAMIRDALYEVRVARARWGAGYACSHCRDGKDLPKGYVCQRCGADNPS